MKTLTLVIGASFSRHSGNFTRPAPNFIVLAALILWAIAPWDCARGDTLISSTTYTYSGSTANYVVPANTNYLIVKAWGAGGGCWVGYLYGGAGGFAEGQVNNVTPGSYYDVEVGGGGLRNTYGGTGGWPDGATGSSGGCGGGGASIFWGGTTYIEAGGGGGASNAPNGIGGGGYYGTPGGLSQGSAVGGGGGTNSAGGSGGQNYFANTTNTTSMGQTGFAATAVNTSDPDYPGDYYGAGGGVNLYDGNPGCVVVKAYQFSIAPTFSGSLSTQSVDQGEPISYTIPASGSPTPTFSASGLPPGLTCNSTTGVITGFAGIGTTGAPTFTYNCTVTATNTYGSVTGTFGWVVTAAQVIPAASISGPNPLLVNDTVSLIEGGTTNFPFGWVWGTMYNPDNTTTTLPSGTSLQTVSYTLNHGAGYYWWNFALDDIYGNYAQEWILIGVNTSGVTPPTTVQATTTGSTFVSLSWSGASAQAGIQYYEVFRDNTFIGATTGTTYTDSTAPPIRATSTRCHGGQ